MVRRAPAARRQGGTTAIDRVARWAPVGEVGLEHLRLRGDAGGILAESVVAGTAGATPFALHYRLRCDSRWHVHEAELTLVGADKRLALLADGKGHWWDDDGRPLDVLAGAIDLDFTATPFTNTLPIRRLRLARGERRELRMGYVTLPQLEMSMVRQRYTCLEPGRLYRFEALDASGFTADLPVDDESLVLDYPGLFTRVA
jgi:hypothetical protein